MDRIGKIFAYCERGLDPTFWAEPLNALSNLGFILAGALALRELMARPAGEGKAVRYALVVLVFIIGIGSFLFHTVAEPWAATADVAPIGLFMLAYFAYALSRFVGLPLWAIPPALAGFAYVISQAMQLQCWRGQIGFTLPVPAFENASCLNGSLGYLPALAAMLLISGLLAARRHPTAPYVLAASLVFMVSLTFRTMDRIWCQDLIVAGRSIGTHFLWHLLNSTTLYLLLLAAVRHGAHGAAPARQHAGKPAA
jgi:hypothetical protein